MTNTFGKFLVQILKLFHTFPLYSSDEETKKNRESIEYAVNKIEEGGLVIIFPNPRLVKNDGEWFDGVGYLLKNIKSRNKCFVVKAYVKNSSILDFLRFIPKTGIFHPTLRVYYSEPEELHKIVELYSEPKKIRKHLEESYNAWIEDINK